VMLFGTENLVDWVGFVHWIGKPSSASRS